MRFLKVKADPLNRSGTPGNAQTCHVNVHDIEEIAEDWYQVTDDQGKEHWKTRPALYLHHDERSPVVLRLNDENYPTCEAVVEKVCEILTEEHARKAVAAYKAIDLVEHPHRLVDRGEWTAGETYRPLDHVTKPDTTTTVLCLAENKSSSPGVLSNDTLWCEITLPT